MSPEVTCNNILPGIERFDLEVGRSQPPKIASPQISLELSETLVRILSGIPHYAETSNLAKRR